MTDLQARIRALGEDRGHLCVGIDPRPDAFPGDYEDADGFQRWCLDLVEATADQAAAFKPNLAFFLNMGPPGIQTLEAVVEAARATGAYTILDAKFGDIGSTAQAYATFAAEVAGVDAVTLNPYLGTDTLEPFQDTGLDVFVLTRTTNPSADTIQGRIHGRVIDLFTPLGVGLVAPGNDPEALGRIREHARTAPLLLPGIGAQGGDAKQAAAAARPGPFLVNVSRGISLAEGTFPESAAQAAARFAGELR